MISPTSHYVTRSMPVPEAIVHFSCSCKFAILHGIIETSSNMEWISSSLRLPEIIHWTELTQRPSVKVSSMHDCTSIHSYVTLPNRDVDLLPDN